MKGGVLATFTEGTRLLKRTDNGRVSDVVAVCNGAQAQALSMDHTHRLLFLV